MFSNHFLLSFWGSLKKTSRLKRYGAFFFLILVFGEFLCLPSFVKAEETSFEKEKSRPSLEESSDKGDETEFSFSLRDQAQVYKNSHIYVRFNEDVSVQNVFILDECGGLEESEYLSDAKILMLNLKGPEKSCRVRLTVQGGDKNLKAEVGLSEKAVAGLKDLDIPFSPVEKIYGNTISATVPLNEETKHITENTLPILAKTEDHSLKKQKSENIERSLKIIGLVIVAVISGIICVISTTINFFRED